MNSTFVAALSGLGAPGRRRKMIYAATLASACALAACQKKVDTPEAPTPGVAGGTVNAPAPQTSASGADRTATAPVAPDGPAGGSTGPAGVAGTPGASGAGATGGVTGSGQVTPPDSPSAGMPAIPPAAGSSAPSTPASGS